MGKVTRIVLPHWKVGTGLDLLTGLFSAFAGLVCFFLRRPIADPNKLLGSGKFRRIPDPGGAFSSGSDVASNENRDRREGWPRWSLILKMGKCSCGCLTSCQERSKESASRCSERFVLPTKLMSFSLREFVRVPRWSVCVWSSNLSEFRFEEIFLYLRQASLMQNAYRGCSRKGVRVLQLYFGLVNE